MSTHLIVDEVHEVSIDSDFILLIIRQFINDSWNGRLVLMSVTIEDDAFANYFDAIPPPSLAASAA